jgi:hypothetical protein
VSAHAPTDAGRAAGLSLPELSRGQGPDFSLVLGGPLFQLMRRVQLTDDALGLLHRRILAAVLIAWAPVVALATAEGVLVGGGLKMPLLHDIAFHLRFLVVVPLLILAELVVHKGLRPVVDEFRQRNLVPPAQSGRFDHAMDEALRLRNSLPAEALMIAFVFIGGLGFTLHRYVSLGAGGWFSSPSGGGGLSLAGMWLVFVSLPLMQFLLLRWYFRLLIWARFLWRTSRLDLDLNAIHPDRAGGLSFLSESLIAFAPIAAAHGVLVAGMLADRIFFGGATLIDFEAEMLGGAIFLLLLFAGPLTLFEPLLARTKLRGLRQYGALGQRYVREFRVKWLGGGPPPDEPLVGSGDIQSLADLGNSFGGAEAMRVVPLKLKPLLVFVGAFLGPILPLVLTMIPLKKLIERVIGVVF